jgi:uncharacterized repeat protein (TIGR04076 family)
MKKVKITILKTMLNEDLAKEYGICGLKACPMMKVGDVFYADYAKPEGFCDEAWKAIQVGGEVIVTNVHVGFLGDIVTYYD